MRITQVVPFIGEEASGPAYTVPQLCLAISKHGCFVNLVTLDGSKNLSSEKINHFLCKKINVFSRLGISTEMNKILHILASNSDVFHNNSLWMMPNVYPCQISKKFKKPLVVTPHGTLSEWAFQSGSKIKKIFWPCVQRPALLQTTCFHATAFSEFEDIRNHGFKQPVAVIPNGIHIPEAAPKKFHSERTLLFLGRIHSKKGLDMLLPAWKVVQDKFPKWKLRVVGPDNQDYFVKVKKLSYDLSLKRVDFGGPLYGNEKWQAYRDADLFILPTYSENFGMSVAEALAAGTPAIVTTGAPWQGLHENGCGWWTEIGIDPLVAALEEAFAKSPEELAEMGSMGREWMRRDFSWYAIGQQMVETYEWVLHGGKKPNFILE